MGRAPCWRRASGKCSLEHDPWGDWSILEVYTISALLCLHECASGRFNNKNLTEKDSFHYECGSWFMYRQQPCVDFEVHTSFQSRDGFLSIPLAYRPASAEMLAVSFAHGYQV